MSLCFETTLQRSRQKMERAGVWLGGPRRAVLRHGERANNASRLRSPFYDGFFLHRPHKLMQHQCGRTNCYGLLTEARNRHRRRTQKTLCSTRIERLER